jgi:uncharacterized protein (TIGR03067 family)
MAKRPPNQSTMVESETRDEPKELIRQEEDHWDEPELPRQRIVAELQSLQGSWVSISGRHQAEFLIAGRLFTTRFEDTVIYMGSLELGPDATPKTMTMLIEEGPAHHKGKTAACIYELDGDYLRFCSTQPGKEEVLFDFPSENDPKYLNLMLRRQTRKRS